MHALPDSPTLADLTTLRLGGPARSVIVVDDVAQLPALAGPGVTEPVLVVGGGSNLVVADAGVDATVLLIALRGLEITPDAEGALVRIGAGEPWDDVVAAVVEQGWCGLAPLSGIPGSTGATPVQNVGAYGREVGDLLDAVEVFDRRTGALAVMTVPELELDYRHSVLRGSDRWIVTAITLRLTAQDQPVRYAELARTLGVQPGEPAPEAAVRDAVLRLRRGKGMVLDDGDPDSRSAGSFFTNPIVTQEEALQILDRIAERLGDVAVPHFPAGPGRVKLSAAWLIDRAGVAKGRPGPGGRVAVSSKHTLALVNVDGSTDDLLALAVEIRDVVRDAFGVTLAPEPIFIGVTWPS